MNTFSIRFLDVSLAVMALAKRRGFSNMRGQQAMQSLARAFVLKV